MGEVTSLKSATKQITGNEVIGFVNGGYITTNGETVDITNVTANLSWAYAIVDCTDGEIFTITGTGGNAPRLYAFLGAEVDGVRPVINGGVAPNGAVIENGYIIAPESSEKLVVNVSVSAPHELIGGKKISNIWDETAKMGDVPSGKTLQGEIDALDTTIDGIHTDIYVKSDQIQVYAQTSGYSLDGDGSASTDENSKLVKYVVSGGDALYLELSADNAGTYQFQSESSPVNASKMVGNPVSGTVDSVVIVPDGAHYLIVSQLKSNTTNKVSETIKLKTVADSNTARISAAENTLNGLYVPGGNLFDKEHPNVINGYFSASTAITADSNRKCVYVPIDPAINANLTVTKTVSSSVLRVGYTETLPEIGDTVENVKSTSGVTRSIDVTLSARYLVVYLYGDSETNTFNDVLGGLVIEYGNTSSGYLPYKIFDPMLQSQMPPFKMANFMKAAKTPIVTLTDDGNNNTDGLDSLHTVCENLGIKCTYACLTYLIDPNAQGYKAEILTRFRTWQAAGYHITTESRTHDDHWATATLDVDACEQDVIASLLTLREQGFIDYEYLCTPNGQRADSVQKMCKKWCKAMITGGSLMNTFYDDGRFNIHRIFIVSDAANGPGLNAYKSMIDECYTVGGWIIFGVHTGDSTEYDASLVSDVMQYALTKGCEVLPLNQAFKIREPIYTWGECFN